MASIKCTTAQAKALYEARSLTGYDRKTKKSAILSQIKRDHGIASSTKLRINILNTDSDLYLVVRDKWTNKPLLNSLPDPVVAVAVQVPAEATPAPATPAPAPTPVAKQAPAKKAAAPARQAPAKKTTPVKPVAAKPLPVAKKAVKPVAAKPLPVAKKAVKPVAKPVKQAPAVKPVKKLGSPTKTDKFFLEVRPSIDGKKVRLGYASSETEKAKMIAAYKASIA